jgi:hypothetical protein
MVGSSKEFGEPGDAAAVRARSTGRKHSRRVIRISLRNRIMNASAETSRIHEFVSARNFCPH